MALLGPLDQRQKYAVFKELYSATVVPPPSDQRSHTEAMIKHAGICKWMSGEEKYFLITCDREHEAAQRWRMV